MHALAPAKINLTLHVIGRLDDGYHALDSLVAFADIGDEIEIRENDEFALEIDGPFAGSFAAPDKGDANLTVRAAQALASIAGRKPALHIRLTKNLPLASGMGGGSSDAATVVKSLLRLWNISLPGPHLSALLRGLGADVPVCFYGRPARIRGTGETFESMTLTKNIPAVLVNPGKACPTAGVFGQFGGPFNKPPASLPPLENFQRLVSFLQDSGNDLLGAAINIVPEIGTVLQTINAQQECAFAGLSGSGATCFGIFADEQAAFHAAAMLKEQKPLWWVKSSFLNPA